MRKRPRDRSQWWMGKVRSVDVGRKLRLVPYWEQAFVDDERINVIIDPGASFGTGDHPSTLMALELAEAEMARLLDTNSSPSVLDAGAGTGALAIAAMKLGSGFAVGFDIDSSAVFTAKRNIGLNKLDSVDKGPPVAYGLFVGELNAVKGRFDLVMANLAAPLLLRLSSHLVACVGDSLILSGIADALRENVLKEYGSRGLELKRSMNRNEWNAALFQRPQ